MSSHLNEAGVGYFQHLARAWKWAFMLIVHGLFPNIWKTAVSDQICVNKEVDSATRKYLLKTMWNIEERDPDNKPSVFSRLTDSEVVARRLYYRSDK